MAFVETLGSWMGLIGGSLAFAWVCFSLVKHVVFNKPRLEIKIQKEGTGIENHEHPLVAGWGFHHLRVRFKIINFGRQAVTVNRILLRGSSGEIISTTCLERGKTLSEIKETRSLTLPCGATKFLSLLRQQAKSIVKAATIPVVLEVYDHQRAIIGRRSFVLTVETYPDENIPAPRDIAEEE